MDESSLLSIERRKKEPCESHPVLWCRHQTTKRITRIYNSLQSDLFLYPSPISKNRPKWRDECERINYFKCWRLSLSFEASSILLKVLLVPNSTSLAWSYRCISLHHISIYIRVSVSKRLSTFLFHKEATNGHKSPLAWWWYVTKHTVGKCVLYEKRRCSLLLLFFLSARSSNVKCRGRKKRDGRMGLDERERERAKKRIVYYTRGVLLCDDVQLCTHQHQTCTTSICRWQYQI